MMSPEGRKKLSKLHLGVPRTPETIAKMRLAALGKHPSIESREKQSAKMRGRPLSTEHRRKLSEGRKGMVFSPEHRANLSAARKGKSFASPESRAKNTERLRLLWQDPTYRKKMSDMARGHVLSPEGRAKIAAKARLRGGDKSPRWKGGISSLPYSSDWTKTLKRSIRERDHYVCRVCGAPQEDIAHDVHHIDYDKQNSAPTNLITLCHACHTKTTQGNREQWTAFLRVEV
jgi:hypothetical protein